MTDKELLELAAKAAEIECFWLFDAYSMTTDFWLSDGEGYTGKWNPLTDDGDEARLECKLGLGIVWYPMCVVVGGVKEWFKDHNNDKQKARRYAGVKAAAIGKSL